jgi:hypothetical protein
MGESSSKCLMGLARDQCNRRARCFSERQKICLQAILYLQTFLSTTLMYSLVMPFVPLYIDLVKQHYSSSSSDELPIGHGCRSNVEEEEGSLSSIYVNMAVGVYPLMAAVASPPFGWWYQKEGQAIYSSPLLPLLCHARQCPLRHGLCVEQRPFCRSHRCHWCEGYHRGRESPKVV